MALAESLNSYYLSEHLNVLWRKKAACCNLVGHKRITVSENGKTFTLLNPRKSLINVIRVDGCVIKNNIACDWLFVPENHALEYFIELKGSDVGRALEQLRSTIEMLSLEKRKLPKKCFVISARCPLVSTEVQIYASRFKKNYNADLLIRRLVYESDL